MSLKKYDKNIKCFVSTLSPLKAIKAALLFGVVAVLLFGVVAVLLFGVVAGRLFGAFHE